MRHEHQKQNETSVVGENGRQGFQRSRSRRGNKRGLPEGSHSTFAGPARSSFIHPSLNQPLLHPFFHHPSSFHHLSPLNHLSIPQSSMQPPSIYPSTHPSTHSSLSITPHFIHPPIQPSLPQVSIIYHPSLHPPLNHPSMPPPIPQSNHPPVQASFLNSSIQLSITYPSVHCTITGGQQGPTSDPRQDSKVLDCGRNLDHHPVGWIQGPFCQEAPAPLHHHLLWIQAVVGYRGP